MIWKRFTKLWKGHSRCLFAPTMDIVKDAILSRAGIKKARERSGPVGTYPLLGIQYGSRQLHRFIFVLLAPCGTPKVHRSLNPRRCHFMLHVVRVKRYMPYLLRALHIGLSHSRHGELPVRLGHL